MDISATLRKYLYLVDLPENDKAIVVNITVSLLYFSFFCVAYFSVYFPAALEITNLHFVYLTKVLSVISILCLNVLLVFILYVRKTNPSSTLPNNIQLYLIGQPLMLYAVLNGIPQLVTGLLLGMLPFLGFIWFNRKHVLYATCLMWIEIVVLAICVSMGLLPNAPLYVNQVKAAQVPTAFVLVQILMSVPFAVVFYVMGHFLMRGIVLRERKILELSRRDSLTNLWNRRYLNEVLAHEIALTQRNLSCLSIMILDLDFFKKINDTYGHATGDAVLLSTAELLQKTARSTDYVGRFGGEEFLVILPNCDAKGAVDVANRYRSMLAEHPIQVDEEILYLTGSFGLTTMLQTSTSEHDKLVSLDQLIGTADKALYDAKAQGRNCVRFRALE